MDHKGQKIGCGMDIQGLKVFEPLKAALASNVKTCENFVQNVDLAYLESLRKKTHAGSPKSVYQSWPYGRI